MDIQPLGLNERINHRHTALIVVDLQNDYAHEEGAFGKVGLPVKTAQSTIAPIRRVIDAAHKVGVLVIFTRNWKTSESISEVALDRDSRSLVGPSGFAETWGAGWYGVEPAMCDLVISKTRYDAFQGTNLEQILRSKKVKTLIIAGVQTNVCVESTARSAYMRDFYVVILEDATATVSDEMHLASLQNIASHFGVVVAVDEVLAVWGDRHEPRDTEEVLD